MGIAAATGKRIQRERHSTDGEEFGA